jgi:RNA polymerase primary sigma factor
MAKLRELKISSDRLTRRTDNTSRYFTEVERRKLLTPDEEYRVAVLAKEGDEEAMNTLVESNLRFVISVAKQYVNQNVSLDELICQGNIGLIHAARTFDPTKGFKFISYAVWHIRKEILYYFNTNYRQIRLPQNIITNLSQIKLADQAIMQKEGRPGTADELREALEENGKDFSEDQIKRFLEAEAHVTPLEASDIEESNSPIDWISSESDAGELVKATDQQIMLKMAMSQLHEIERQVILRRHGLHGKEPEAFSTISEYYDRSSEWARQVYTKAVRRLKKKLMRVRDQFEI